MDYQRTAASEWEWQNSGRHYAVRVFAKTRKLVWSSWAETSEAPLFEEGFAQSFEGFLRGEPPPNDPPPALIDELRTLLSDEAKPKRKLFFHRK